ncbi:Putative lipoprotein [Serinicoccus hydrothermalis]|uniref:Lipoprotein n=1 Tax=Serinicoccus hydrothermalis TaxID=1758689 RepID=A0A1B1NBE1_9MICO|nr:hypothetical protein [Serinicoccus hydrothermalis]ANS78714.1 Putative lipoprotein [Serinicoccus hydrothermalis]
MSSTRKRLGAIVSAGVLSLGLAACGGGESTDPEGGSGEASSTEDAQESSAPETSEEDAAGADDTSEAAAADGEEIPVEDFLAMMQEPGEETLSSYTLTMSMDASGQAMDAEGAVDLSGEQPLMQITMTMPQVGDMEMITTGGEVYLAMPGVTPEGMYVRGGEDLLGQAGAMEDLDVSTQWEAWEQGAQSVVLVGEEDVDGTEMRHYQVTLDPEAAAAAGGEAATTAAPGMPDTVVYEVWLDDDNLMRQLTFDLEGVSMEMTTDNWGEPQEIQAPAEDQVMEMSELGGQPGSDG